MYVLEHATKLRITRQMLPDVLAFPKQTWRLAGEFCKHVIRPTHPWLRYCPGSDWHNKSG